MLVPRFPLAVELLSRTELRGLPVVLGGAPEERKIVVECSPEAERAGVRRGMQLREALSRCRDTFFLEARPAVYAGLFERVLDALEQISPVVEGAGLGYAFVDLTGLQGVGTASGERALAETAQRAVKETLGLTPRVGIADSRFAAWAAAMTLTPMRSASEGAAATTPANNASSATDTRVRIVTPGEAASFLASLSVDRLPVSDEMRRRLRWLGLKTAGELAALPRATLAAQFGPEGERAWDLARGEGGEAVIPRRHEPDVSADVDFDQPVTETPAILAAARHLLNRLFRQPACAGRSIRGVELKASLSNGHRWQRLVTFREPVTDQGRMARIIGDRIEGVVFPAAVESLELRLHDLCAETGIQSSLFSARARDVQGLDDALEHLHARFGHPLVMKIVGVEPWSRIPERQYALIAYEPSIALSR
ncbi:MAG: hypothetical protein HYX51_06860 [Chloroflexi bacterium]|nr:hypothetical protein [Chloroflexota bacterium]